MILQAVKYISLSLALSFAMVHTAFAVEIGSVANSRLGAGYTMDGPFMARTRDKLLHAGNFGPAGTFPLDLNITDTAAPLDETLLSNFDVFFIGWLSDSAPDAITGDELNALWEWVGAGGVLIASCDDATHDDVCQYFGQHVQGGEYSTMTSAPSTGDHPIWDGPFGAVNAVSAGGGVTAVFLPFVYGKRLGLAEDNNTMLSVERFGDGVIIYVSDVNTLTDTFLSEGTGISTENDKFMANTFAFAAASALSMGVVENPANGGVASGISVFSGWWCDAGEIYVTIDGGVPKLAAYGTTRNDTRSVCGDANNGWALLFNYGLLGDGVHTAVVTADGETIGSTTFTVTTYGTSFLAGESGDFLINDFPNPGNTAVYTWSQPNQNLILKSYVP